MFLSLAFGHLIPECIHGFSELPGDRNETIPYMAILFGYLVIFFMEKVAFDHHGLLNDMETEQKSAMSPSAAVDEVRNVPIRITTNFRL